MCTKSLLNTHISYLNKFYIARIWVIWDFYTCYKTQVKFLKHKTLNLDISVIILLNYTFIIFLFFYI